MKNKKWLLLVIIAFPSFFWLILETSTINSRKLPYYGPKKAVAKGDTIFYTLPDIVYTPPGDSNVTASKTLNHEDFPLYALMFINGKYRADSYRLTGLWEYLNYKKEKVQGIPFVLVTENENGKSQAYEDLKNLDKNKNVHFYTLPKVKFDSLTKLHFKEKPYFIDYSFFILVDQNRSIRGYYDGRYVSEIKRLIEEYKHLRLKDEKQKLIKSNEIKSES